MQALSMIDTLGRTENTVPARPAAATGDAFARVMKTRQREETTAPAEAGKRPSTAGAAAAKPPRDGVEQKNPAAERESAGTDPLENSPAGTDATPLSEEDSGASGEETAQPAAATEAMADTLRPAREDSGSQLETNVQQVLMQLMKLIDAEPTGTPGEQVADLEKLLGRLVQQLDAGELKSGQAPAAVDPGRAAEQLRPNAMEAGGNPLLRLAEQLVRQIDRQPAAEPNPSAADMLQTPAQETGNTPQAAVVNLGQVRQILQQALDGIGGAQPASTTTAREQIGPDAFSAGNESLAAIPEDNIDARFAGLLKPRADKALSAQSQQPGATVEAVRENAAGKAEGLLPDAAALSEGSSEADFVQSLQHHTKPEAAPPNVQIPGAFPGATAASRMVAATIPQTSVVQLAGGHQVAESQIFDQVVSHISGSYNGESGRMVLRLQPAELGSLKLELTVEGDRIRANLHAQSTQVQEVLERNLPQLRNALAEQGLKIDQFQVNIDQRQQGGHFENLAQRQENGDFAAGRQRHREAEDEHMIPLSQLMNNSGGGISLRV